MVIAAITVTIPDWILYVAVEFAGLCLLCLCALGVVFPWMFKAAREL